MSKYSKEFKIKLVNEYLNGNLSYNLISKKYNMKDSTALKSWVKKYNVHGIQGIVRSRINYDGNFKINVIKYMHSNHLSLRDTSAYFNLGDHSIISKWERIYYEEGPQALFEERRGRRKNMSSKLNKKKLSKEVEQDLIAEVQQLRMENAYLKKLNALVQERIKRENKKK